MRRGAGLLLALTVSSLSSAQDDTWKALETAGGPTTVRSDHTAVWTGSRMIVWGGRNPQTGVIHGDGFAYDPASNGWAAISATGAPSPRYLHVAVWTGTKMIVWGGWDGSSMTATGAVYDPSTDSWTPMATAGGPAGAFAAVWTGAAMIVWNGCDVVGGRYDPAADAWTPVTNVNAPTGCFSDKCVVWTGSRMLAWYSTTSMGQYDPVQDVWLPMSPTNGPPFRYDTRCAWTGRYLFLFGGKATEIDSVAAGGRYDPQADAWLPVTSTGAVARHEHTMIWTGGRVVLWGGNLGRFRTNTGARYDPVNDVWAATSVTAQTPTARGEHTAVWTGNEMLVWGGGSASTNFVGGAYTVAVDTDGDGTLDQDDCDPWDETAIEVPSEVDSFGFGAESTELAWTPSSAGSGTVYDLLRGPLDAGPVGSPEEECLAGSIEEATFSDPALPGEGSGYRYLVRARNACGVGTYGDSSAGERVATACP